MLEAVLLTVWSCSWITLVGNDTTLSYWYGYSPVRGWSSAEEHFALTSWQMWGGQIWERVGLPLAFETLHGGGNESSDWITSQIG